MDKEKKIGTYAESEANVHVDEVMDDLASDGVFFVYDEDDPCPYNVRKYADMVKRLGLKKGEVMPDEYLEQCLV